MRLFLLSVLGIHLCRLAQSAASAAGVAVQKGSLATLYRTGLVMKLTTISSEFDVYKSLLVHFKDTQITKQAGDSVAYQDMRVKIRGIASDVDERRGRIARIMVNLNDEEQFPSSKLKGVNLLGEAASLLEDCNIYFRHSSEEVHNQLPSLGSKRIGKAVRELKEAINIQVQRVQGLIDVGTSIESIKLFVHERQVIVEQRRKAKLAEAQEEQQRQELEARAKAAEELMRQQSQLQTAAKAKNDELLIRKQQQQIMEAKAKETEQHRQQQKLRMDAEARERQRLLENERKKTEGLARAAEAKAKREAEKQAKLAEAQQRIADEKRQRDANLLAAAELEAKIKAEVARVIVEEEVKREVEEVGLLSEAESEAGLEADAGKEATLKSVAEDVINLADEEVKLPEEEVKLAEEDAALNPETDLEGNLDEDEAGPNAAAEIGEQLIADAALDAAQENRKQERPKESETEAKIKASVTYLIEELKENVEYRIEMDKFAELEQYIENNGGVVEEVDPELGVEWTLLVTDPDDLLELTAIHT